MTKSDALVLAAVFLVAYVAGRCSELGRAETAALRAAGRATDSSAQVTDRRVVELAAREVQRESVISRQNGETEVLRQEVRTLRHRAVRVDTLTAPVELVEQVALRDSVIAAQDTIIARQDTALTLLRLSYNERGALMSELTSQRDAYRSQRDSWQQRASRRIVCGVGPGVTVSLGGRALGGVSAACVIKL